MRTLKALCRSAWAVLAVLAWVALQACGPGVGGSGTGQGMDAFGASAVQLCSSDIAPALACPAATASPAASAVPGSGGLVTVQGNSIELNAPCAGISFRGDWGQLAGQAARFYGFNGEGSSAQPAQVRASLASASVGGLLLTVLDANGHLLLGPVLVTLRATPAQPGAC